MKICVFYHPEVSYMFMEDSSKQIKIQQYEIIALEVNNCKNVGLKTLMKNWLSLRLDQKSVINLGWLGIGEEDDDLTNNNLYFDIMLPLNMILRFAEDYRTIVVTVKYEVILTRAKINISVLLQAPVNANAADLVAVETWKDFDILILTAAVFIKEDKFLSLINILNSNSPQKIKEYQEHGTWLYKRYFSSTKIITETVLEIMSDRIFPYSSKSYNYWNEQNFKEIVSPVLIPLTISRTEGFTAVILTYDRLDLLFLLINKLSRVKSLTKIVVIWNNKYKSPPRISRWPKTHKTVKVILTDENLLSNRFYPFDDIETEAIFAIDDDIIMLTEDEIEFAFEVIECLEKIGVLNGNVSGVIPGHVRPEYNPLQHFRV
ncbi:exostosin-2-like [Copidosoma floridanum]|uniref:exostosin-2-like n=1 Tax=Copidosoma floridanum TaxID=29053 RepID=UPI0006C9667C|nr:exostosin-2-like [Copidosoma floridanum]